jgi:hypothetical protein
MEKFKKNILPFLILFLLVGFFVSFRTFLMNYIIGPIALLFWAVWRIISSVDQNLYWIALIVICAILVVRLIPSEKEGPPSPSYLYTYKPSNRVEYWQTIIDESGLGKHKREYLRNRIKELMMTVISQVEQPATTELDEIVAAGTPSLPPEARQYLFPSNGEDGISSIKDRLNHNVFLPRWLRKWRRKYILQNNARLDEVLKWMETELEIDHEK